MAHVADPPSSSELAGHVTPAGETAVQHPPVSPGKVAMWLFLATEIMFFTGLIGSYIVLRNGSPLGSYSNLYAPATDLSRLENTKGVLIKRVGPNREQVVDIYRRVANTGRSPLDVMSREYCEELIDAGEGLTGGMPPA